MPKPAITFDMIKLFEQFIRNSRTGKRLQPNGKKVSTGTLESYKYSLLLLKNFSSAKDFHLRIKPVRRLTTRELSGERKFWKKFYLEFTNFMYDDCGHYDNYVGNNIKNIKSFFSYLNKDLGLGVGEFHKQFYVRKEEVPIFPLQPEELQFLIYNMEFERSLKPRMRQVKDFFVFGCTVALRFSDLINLQRSNIRIVNGQHYLSTRSVKTSSDSLVRLPQYAVEIINKYARKKGKLLPKFNIVNLNKFVKQLLEQAGFTQEVTITRSKRGKAAAVKAKVGKSLRFCDVVTTHTMRRTAITTMLSLGMAEQLVRKISGHSPSGKEFYRYVSWAQGYQDQESEKVFARLIPQN